MAKEKNRELRNYYINIDLAKLLEKHVKNFSDFVNEAIEEKLVRMGLKKLKITSREIK